MKKKNKILLLVIVNCFLVAIMFFVLTEGNKTGVFYDTAGDLSHLYIADNIVYIKEHDFFSIDRIMFLEKDKGNNAIYLSKNNLVDQESEDFFLKFADVFYQKREVERNVNLTFSRHDNLVNSASTSLEFAKINSAKYLVRIKNFKNRPFLLVFLEGFDKNWEIFRTEDVKQFFWSSWFKEPISTDNHYVINGFANSWWIDQADLGDEEVFIIEYSHQKKFYLALLVVFATSLFCVNYLTVKG